MNPFKYERVNEYPEATMRVASQQKAMFIAGGTNVLDLFKEDVQTPATLVDIRKVPAREITELPGGGLRLGAAATNSAVANHTLVRERYPVLSEAILAGASQQLRNMATVGGNLMQRTRCPYFHNVSFACNKRTPGTGRAAINGVNRMNAIFGTSDSCIAAHPSDMCVPLAALEAVVQTLKPDGSTRSIPFADFHLLPGDTPHLETILEHGEVITAVDLPPLEYAERSHYLKIRDRLSYAFALVSAAVVLDLEGNRIRQARVALGGVGAKPWRSHEAEEVLTNAPATGESFKKAAAAALADAKPRKFNRFKIELAKLALEDALLTATAMEVD